MKLRYEKSMRVLTDIMGYCHLIGGQHFSVDFNMSGSQTEIEIKTQLAQVEQSELDNLNTMLNIPRQREVEQYYWNISGEEEIDNELSLAGMMVDEATVAYEDGVLTVTALRLDASDEA